MCWPRAFPMWVQPPRLRGRTDPGGLLLHSPKLSAPLSLSLTMSTHFSPWASASSRPPPILCHPSIPPITPQGPAKRVPAFTILLPSSPTMPTNCPRGALAPWCPHPKPQQLAMTQRASLTRGLGLSTNFPCWKGSSIHLFSILSISMLHGPTPSLLSSLFPFFSLGQKSAIPLCPHVG
ncbi:hypothetical protein EI94DRAFT_1010295 [Lactarius quietus]|nr:hypothetical protein EI94DRAFT_1010295 [Lactarius quietus]